MNTLSPLIGLLKIKKSNKHYLLESIHFHFHQPQPLIGVTQSSLEHMSYEPLKTGFVELVDTLITKPLTN